MVNALIQTKFNPRETTSSVQKWWDAVNRKISDFFEGKIISDAMTILLVVIAIFLVLGIQLFRILRQRRRIRRRAVKIGLDNLPNDEQIRLVRQLGFYEQ